MKARSMIGLAFVALLAGVAAEAAEGDLPVARHVIYVHGRIVQDRQDPRPEHPEFGFYELEKILETFRERGFEVSGGIRPRDATVSDAADVVVAQVDSLLESGVPADRVTVVGASMGAVITLVASARLGNPELRFAVLGTCLSMQIPRILEREGKAPTGRILAIRESSDRVTGQCPPLAIEPGAEDPREFKEILLETGLDHGFLYRPLPDWVEPVVEWASRED